MNIKKCSPNTVLHCLILVKTKSNYNGNNQKDLLKYLLNVDAKLLTSSTYKSLSNTGMPSRETQAIWLPIVEVENAIEPFLLVHPNTLVVGNQYNNIETLFGFASKV